MKHSRIRDFCRYLSGSAGFDDRLGVIVFEDFSRAQRCLCLVARKLRASLELYAGNDTQLIQTLAKRANSRTPCLILLECPPSSQFRALLNTMCQIAARPISQEQTYACEPRLVLAASRVLYFGLPQSDPVRRIGCCIQLEAEVFETGGDKP